MKWFSSFFVAINLFVQTLCCAPPQEGFLQRALFTPLIQEDQGLIARHRSQSSDQIVAFQEEPRGFSGNSLEETVSGGLESQEDNGNDISGLPVGLREELRTISRSNSEASLMGALQIIESQEEIDATPSEREFECSICKTVLNISCKVPLSCSHLVCQNCIHGMQLVDGNHSCPVCREPVASVGPSGLLLDNLSENISFESRHITPRLCFIWRYSNFFINVSAISFLATKGLSYFSDDKNIMIAHNLSKKVFKKSFTLSLLTCGAVAYIEIRNTLLQKELDKLRTSSN